MFICSQQLNEAQLQKLKRLTDLCQDADGGLPAIYYHLLRQKRYTESNVCYSQGGKLLGFLSLYFFYEDACEISLMVDPAHRKQGIASQLLRTVIPLLEARDMAKLIFSSAPSFCDTWVAAKEFTYEQSEYHMERNSYETILITNPLLTMRKATLDDLNALHALDLACFSEHQSNMPERLVDILNDSAYTVLLALYNNLPVGKAHIHWQPDSTLLSDIAIHPDYQGKGHGNELLANCINKALSIGKIKLALDVESKNQKALNLYLKYGFKTTIIYDYWSIPFETLRANIALRT